MKPNVSIEHLTFGCLVAGLFFILLTCYLFHKNIFYFSHIQKCQNNV